MDTLTLKREKVEEALSGLKFVNRYLGNTSTVINAIKEYIAAKPNAHIVDLGCGGGDLLREIKTHFPNARLTGIDGNVNVINYAKQQDNSIDYFSEDILASAFLPPECDVLISSHFLYRFNDLELRNSLVRWKPKVKQKIIISELQRSMIAYWSFSLLSVVLRFPTIVKNDGLIAIKRAFREEELKQVLSKCNFKNYSIKWKWAFRYIIEITP